MPVSSKADCLLLIVATQTPVAVTVSIYQGCKPSQNRPRDYNEGNCTLLCLLFAFDKVLQQVEQIALTMYLQR